MTVTMIDANLAVWILSELPDRAAAIRDTSFSASGRIPTQQTPRSALSPF